MRKSCSGQKCFAPPRFRYRDPARAHAMNTKDLIALGVPPGEATRRGLEFIAHFILKGGDKTRLPGEIGRAHV